MIAPALAAWALSGCGEDTTLRKVAATGFFDPPALDYGVRNVGLTYTLRTSLRNTSAQTLRVEQVRFEPANDLFVARRDDEIGGTLRGTTLDPGERVDILVRYAPREEGVDDVIMTIVFDEFEIDVRIAATARQAEPARPALNPSAVTFLDVPLNGEASQRLEITNQGETDGAVRAIQARPPFFVRAVGGAPLTLPSPALAPGESLAVEVVYRPTLLTRSSDAVVFEFDSRRRAILQVVGQSSPAGVLLCQPAFIDFEDVPRGQIVTERIECEASGGPYTLAQVRFRAGSSPSFRLPAPLTPLDADRRVAFDLEFVSDSLPRAHEMTLELVAGHGAVTTVDGRATTVAPTIDSTVIGIELGWDTARSDFDLHFVRSQGQLFTTDDCYWAEKNPEWGAPDERLDNPFLDRDDTDGFGPEVINLAIPAETEYDVYIQYFNFSGPTVPPTTAQVRIALNGGMPVTLEERMVDCGLMWHVGQIRVDQGVATFTEQGELTDAYRAFARARCQ